MTASLLLVLLAPLSCSAMDMSGHSGIPWLDSPVMLHSSREDSCKLTPEQCEYRHGFWRYWYKADYRFARTTVYFILALIGFFAIGNIISRLESPSLQRNGLWRWSQAALRYVGYRGFRVRRLDWYSPSLAYLLVGLAGAVFFIGMTLGPQPYYWPNARDGSVSFGGSPPLATRTGWMAVALLPFVVVLAAKANWVTAVTGVSHEKLQVFHRYASYAMFVLALIHTFPFIVYNIWIGDMEEEWSSSVVYWTGVVAIVFQAYLTAMSCGPIRNRFYEFFKATHYLAALIFIVFFFIHCDFRLTSWDYFIATGTLYLSSLLYSHLRATLSHGGPHHTAHLTPIPSTSPPLLAITIPLPPALIARSPIPTDLAWRPAQHAFLRFLDHGFLPAASAHPFTICSLPPLASDESAIPQLRFVVRPAKGLTARLLAAAQDKPGRPVRVAVDGPYGGVRRRLAAFGRVLVVVGGSGAGFSLPVVEEVVRAAGTEGRRAEVRVVVAVRDGAVGEWYAGEVGELLARCGGRDAPVSVSAHVTGEARGRVGEKAAGDVVVWKAGRPELARIVAECASEPGVSLAIAVCGPAGMLYDVRNAAAEAQKSVMSGTGAREVYLHSEHFSW
ncbi:FAD-binding 8 [Neofusicoccum parvum]|uniref:FAD-binding 8 n=1 Tax=Neofusicoccum parvum TaxID=310453 RepID=A0ACB5S281_9PEZI|nr:FAD-binding 8 [Neofusicoccum parvum]